MTKFNPYILLLKLSFSVFLFLFFLEIILRFYSPLSFNVKGGRIVLPANKEYVFENRSNPRLDPVVVVRKNSFGFRGEAPPPDLGNQLSIVTVGGSAIICDLLTEGKIWTGQLYRSLKEMYPNVWVNNAGLTGHSTIGHITLLKEHVVKIHPKVIVFLIGINDIGTEHAWIYDDNILKWKFDFYSFKIPKRFRFYSDFIHFTSEGAAEVSRLIVPGVKQILEKKGYRSTKC